jgi:hypothetical protein
MNQSDDIEKGQRVGMLGDIYRLAGTVLVWFGPEDQNTAELWKSVRRDQDPTYYKKVQTIHRTLV